MIKLRSGATGTIGRISAKQAVSDARSGALCVIDVRDISEIRVSGIASGALHIPLMLLSVKADPRSPEAHPALSTAKPVGVYCATGARSQMAAQMLAQMGYETVYNLGGLYDWASAGGDIERPGEN